MELKNYTQKKDELKENFLRLQVIAESLDLKNLKEDLAKNIILLNHESFELVVVGEFSRGKSTFINAMLGSRILPASKKPTTTIISKIVYGDTPKYCLIYKTGKQKNLSEENFIKLTAPKEADASDKIKFMEFLHKKEDIGKIDYAIVSYPLDFCRDNVEIIDTPGINDLNNSRVDITYRYLNRADAVIIVLAANQPLTNSEMDFLKDRILSNQISDIFFVINFKDEAKTNQEEKAVVDYVKKELEPLMIDNDSPLRMYLVSSKQALSYRRLENGREKMDSKTLDSVLRWKPESLESTGFPEFEKNLEHFLVEEKGNVKLKKYIKIGLKSAATLEKNLCARIEMASHSADEVREQVNQMKMILGQSKNDVNKVVVDLENNLKLFKNDLYDTCLFGSSDIQSAVSQKIDQYDGEWTSNAIAQVISKSIAIENRKFVEKIKKTEEKYIQTEGDKAQEKLITIWSNIDSKYQKNFSLPDIVHTKQELSTFLVEMNKESLCDANTIGSVVGGVVNEISFSSVLMKIASFFGLLDNRLRMGSERSEKKAKIKQNLYIYYEKEYKKIIQKLLKEYDKMIQEYTQDVKNEANRRIEDIQGQLCKIEKMKNMKEEEADVEQRNLNQMMINLESIYERLHSYQH